MTISTSQKVSPRLARVAVCVGFVTSLAWLAGCAAHTSAVASSAATPPAVDTNAPAAAAKPVLPAEDWVKQRSEARWKLMLQGRYFDAYEFLAPALKKVTSADSYAKGFGPASLWISTETKTVECSHPERCVVTLEVEARVATPSMRNKPTKGQVQEVWIFEDGNWWHYDK